MVKHSLIFTEIIYGGLDSPSPDAMSNEFNHKCKKSFYVFIKV